MDPRRYQVAYQGLNQNMQSPQLGKGVVSQQTQQQQQQQAPSLQDQYNSENQYNYQFKAIPQQPSMPQSLNQAPNPLGVNNFNSQNLPVKPLQNNNSNNNRDQTDQKNSGTDRIRLTMQSPKSLYQNNGANNTQNQNTTPNNTQNSNNNNNDKAFRQKSQPLNSPSGNHIFSNGYQNEQQPPPQMPPQQQNHHLQPQVPPSSTHSGLVMQVPPKNMNPQQNLVPQIPYNPNQQQQNIDNNLSTTPQQNRQVATYPTTQMSMMNSNPRVSQNAPTPNQMTSPQVGGMKMVSQNSNVANQNNGSTTGNSNNQNSNNALTNNNQQPIQFQPHLLCSPNMNNSRGVFKVTSPNSSSNIQTEPDGVSNQSQPQQQQPSRYPMNSNYNKPTIPNNDSTVPMNAVSSLKSQYGNASQPTVPQQQQQQQQTPQVNPYVSNAQLKNFNNSNNQSQPPTIQKHNYPGAINNNLGQPLSQPAPPTTQQVPQNPNAHMNPYQLLSNQKKTNNQMLTGTQTPIKGSGALDEQKSIVHLYSAQPASSNNYQMEQQPTLIPKNQNPKMFQSPNGKGYNQNMMPTSSFQSPQSTNQQLLMQQQQQQQQQQQLLQQQQQQQVQQTQVTPQSMMTSQITQMGGPNPAAPGQIPNNMNNSQIIVFQNGQPMKQAPSMNYQSQPGSNQMPSLKHQQQHQQIPSQQQIDFEGLVMELQVNRDMNNQLQSKIIHLEAEMSQMLPPSYIAELEKQTKLLINENDRLCSENERLVGIVNNNEANNANQAFQIQSLQLQNDNLARIVGQVTNEMEMWRSRYEDAEDRVASTEMQLKNQELQTQNDLQIKTLVADLEQKVQSLIGENERLNSMLSDQMRDIENYEGMMFSFNQLKIENQRLSNHVKNHNKQMEIWRKKYDDLEKQLSQLMQAGNTVEDYKERVEDLEMKIQILIEENDKLNQAVNENMQTINGINALQEQVNQLLIENQRLDNTVIGLKSQCKLLEEGSQDQNTSSENKE